MEVWFMRIKLTMYLTDDELKALTVDAQKYFRPLRLHAQYLLHNELMKLGLLQQPHQITQEIAPIDDIKLKSECTFDITTAGESDSKSNGGLATRK
jgi:hypothetical protein